MKSCIATQAHPHARHSAHGHNNGALVVPAGTAWMWLGLLLHQRSPLHFCFPTTTGVPQPMETMDTAPHSDVCNLNRPCVCTSRTSPAVIAPSCLISSRSTNHPNSAAKTLPHKAHELVQKRARPHRDGEPAIGGHTPWCTGMTSSTRRSSRCPSRPAKGSN